MKSISYKQQFFMGIAVLSACFILAAILNQGIVYNIGWVLDGLLFVIHPVCPEAWRWRYGDDDDRMKRDFRIAGAVVILFGLIVRYAV